MNNQENTGKVQLTVSGILEDLENGMTRFKGQKGYSQERGSIEEKYNLSKNDIKTLFEHPKLKGRKTKRVQEVAFVLVDDVTEEGQEQE
jgi:hypothetical protein